MSGLTERLATLSPEKRRLLELRMARTRAEAAGGGIRPRPRPDGAGPVSSGQQRLWLLERMGASAATYNSGYALRLRGELHAAALERAVNAVVQRHEALRTTFADCGDDVVQVVQPFTAESLPVTSLEHLPEAERSAAAGALASALAAEPFDLARGPLLRRALFRLDGGDHLLLLAMHHIVCDGWSIGVLGRELAALYEAFAQGRPGPLPPLEVQYADFAAWQREQLAGSGTERDLEFWRGALAGAPPALGLPADRVRPAAFSGRGAELHRAIPAELAGRLRELGRAEGATVFPVLLAAFRVVLGRHAGQDDVVIGTAVAARTRREIEPLIGFFVNTLPLRTPLSGGLTFRALLARERDTVVGAFGHQELPFDRLVEELKLPRDASRNPLFQAMLTLQTVGARAEPMAGLAVEVAELGFSAAKFDLTFDIYEVPDGALTLRAEWATDLFDRATIERLVEHFEVVLQAVVAQPDTRVPQLPLMSPAEHAATAALGAAAAAHPVRDTLHARFAAQAARTPDATAVTFGEAVVTYRELDERANRVAHRLVALGAGPEVLVGLCVERSVETVAGILAILKSGAAYLPLDPAYPEDRLAYMLEDSGVSVVLTTSHLAERLPASATLVRFDADAEAIGTEPSDPPPERAAPGSLAYVIYTSGSTGRPKGVQVTHANVLRLMDGTAPRFAFRPDDVWTLFHSYAFDFSVWEIWGALLHGGRLVVVPVLTGRDPEAFYRLLTDERVTVLNQTPSAFRELMRVDQEVAETGVVHCAALRYVIFGGEALDPASLRGWVDRRGDETPRLVNMYGITETTVHVTHSVIRGRDVRVAPRSPIGVPIEDLSVHLLDAEGQLVPVGVVGEMHVGGGGVARGYLNRPGLTAQRFVPDPFSGVPGTRLYRSGDLARRLADARLEFVGRVDAQVKVRGFRIEPGEIEVALCRHPAVGGAAVVARGGEGERTLVAYVVPRNGARPGAAELRDALRGRMPEYMLPAAFVVLDAFPLTANGKVDRAALPAPESTGGGVGKVAPRTATERALAEIWAEVLGRPSVAADDDFFLLGGHSLLATRVVSRVRQALGAELPLRAVFEAGTLGALAARVDAARGVEGGGPALVPRGGEPALSFAQERMWFLDQMAPEEAIYNVPLALDVDGPLDVEALRRAIEGVVTRHEALRATFPARDGRPVPRIHPPAPFLLPLLEVADEADLERKLAAAAATPFQLAEGPLVRGTLFRRGPDAHVLLVNSHHAVSDGWSQGVFFRELAELYAAAMAEREASLDPLPIQYADFAAWQREWLSGDRLAGQVRFWRDRLRGAPAVLELPTDRPRPARPSHRGGLHPFHVPAATAARLRSLAAGENATLFMVTLAAFQALLGRYARQDDVVVGTPIAGRNRAETEPLIGLFVNTLALRAGLGGDPTFRALLGQVRETTLEAYAHQDLPFERLVDELKVERSTAYPPLFQVLFALQNAPAPPPRLAGARVGFREVEYRVAKFDLTAQLYEEGGELLGWLEYAGDLWDAGTAGRMVQHYLRLLDSAAAHPDRPLSALEVAGEDERRRVAAWSRGADYALEDRGVPVHHLFRRQAAAAPHAVALAWDGGTMAYGELDAAANRLANHLLAVGVRPGSRVGVCLERGPRMIAGVLAALKAGCAYVPLDPLYPADRLAYMAADARMAAVVVDAGTRASAEGAGAMIVDLDQSAAAIERASRMDPGVDLGPEALAYVIYTSGSTGRPKGVAVPHRGIVRLVRGADYADLGPSQSFLQIVPVSFDVATWEMWAPLLNGGRLVLYPPRIPEPREIAQVVRRHGVTTLWLTSGLFHVVADEAMEAFQGLQQFFSGGDILSVSHVRRLRETYPGLRIVDGYGPTENTTYTSCHTVRAADLDRVSIPIGRPVAGTSVYVLDRDLRPCPVGVPGPLYTGGDGLATGYLERPALTAEKFIPDPFSGLPGARLYTIGDLGRWLDDGTLEFLGRVDTQLKVRGFRIEPGEIEAALQAHPGVEDACVVARTDTRGDKRIVAYVVPRGDGMPEAAALRAAVRERLPDYMVPSAFVPMAGLPLNPNGKVDRASLPAPELGDGRDFAEPRREMELALAEVWRELLGVDRIGLDDGFFDLGGHSLLATQLISRIRGLGAEVPLRAVFEAPTLRALAERVEGSRAAKPSPEPPLAPLPRGGDAAFPLSFAQERMWFISRMLPSAAYNMPFRLRLHGPLDADALRGALGDLVTRHEPLRTTFAVRGGSPVQVIAPAGEFPLPVTDLSTSSVEDAEGEADRIAADEAVKTFDLAAGPLFRARLVRIAAGEHLLLLDMHHVAGDGWSMEVAWRELAALYEARLHGRPAGLPPLPIQYADYAAWQRQVLSGERLEARLGYWRRALAGAPPLELPTDRPRPATASLRGAWYGFRLERETADAVSAIARAEGATLFQALLAGFALLLSRYSGQDDVVVGSPIAGRTRGETEGLIGLFVNTLAMRADLSGDPGFRELVRRVRGTALDAYAHQDVPFEKLVDELKAERSLSRHPLFQVTFTLDEGAADAPRLGGARAVSRTGETRTAKFDLTAGFTVTPGGLEGGFEYATDLFDAATIQRMAGHLSALLAGGAADPDTPVSRLPGLLQGADRAKVLEEWSGWCHSFPAGHVHEMFADRARRTPDAPALRFCGRDTGYRALDEAANRLAHHLLARGVRPDTAVGVFADRAPETVVAILAVLKAGGAYVPLDPAYPAERLRSMLADAGVRTAIAPAGPPAGLPPGLVADLVDLRAEADTIRTRPADDPRVPLHPDHLAYVIYTSGSTGVPKGVMVPHRGVPNLVWSQVGRFGVGAGSRVLQFASFSFDAAVSEIFTALAVGGVLVLAPREELVPGPALAELLRRERITVATLPPSVLAVLADADFPELRTLVSAGEAVGPGVVERWAPGRRFVNAYGPTENTVAICSGECVPDGRTPSMGVPLENVRAYVLDGAGQPAPIGVPGELCAGGAGVARGYRGRPGQTAERFVPDPFGAAGARLYRTGDRVRWLPDGRLEFLGRVDEQVKLRGFRVEPGEVAARIAGLPGVRDALVLVREDRPGDRGLVAYVVPVQGAGAPRTSELRDHLKRVLPGYMVPRAFVTLDAFPHTPNGKVDRAALPAPADDSGIAPQVAPQGELERRIAAVWAAVLGRAAVGVNDNFFDIGGHSLLLAQLQERLEAALERTVGLIDLFQYPTVAALASRLDAQAKASAVADTDGDDADPSMAQPAAPAQGRGAARRQMLQRGRK